MTFTKRLIAIICVFALLCQTPLAYAKTSSAMTSARVKYHLAVSDYGEAIAACNGALRKSAERQLNRVKDTCSSKKNEAFSNYRAQVQNLKNTYDQLAQHFQDPSAGKAALDQVINAVGVIPGVGLFTAAYSAANGLHAYADEAIRSREGKAILKRAQQQFDQLAQYHEDYNKWDAFQKEISRRQHELDRQFDRNCAGRDTGEWRYHDLDPATAHQSGIGDVSHSGNDNASGEIFEGRIRNNTGRTIVVVYLPGGWLIPIGMTSQRMVIIEGGRISVPPGGVVTYPLGGFCADPRSFPPSPGNPERYFPSGPQTFTPDGNPFNREFAIIPLIPGIVTGLINSGSIPRTGLPPEMELITLIQWYLWNLMENFNPEDGRAKINEQVKDSGSTQTPAQITELNNNIWIGINTVGKRVRQEASRIATKNQSQAVETEMVPLTLQGGGIEVPIQGGQ
ncbi:hypothetical protein ACFL96_15975 [Thermoproteota archaeon]